MGLRIKNDVASVTKQEKNQLGLVCQYCNNKEEIDADHKPMVFSENLQSFSFIEIFQVLRSPTKI